MNTKHTPGPWRYSDHMISSQTAEHGATIATLNHTSRAIPDAEVEANGRLLAAAPEMKELLERLIHPAADDSDVANARVLLASLNA
jgi:hypothetical protein